MELMKNLIVNADDFGYSYGINKGIIEAHVDGIVTATSVMVDSIAAHEAADLKKYPELSVGLHFFVTEFEEEWVRAELARQTQKFIDILNVEPDHINTHKIFTTEGLLKEILLEYAKNHGIPLRRHSPAKFIGSYFGPHADGDVSVAQFKNAIDQATDEYNEIMCHVGFSDDYLRETSSYNDMREQELATICSAEVKQYLLENEIQLCNWKALAIK
jgi:chitin disaccharide deacetylase